MKCQDHVYFFLSLSSQREHFLWIPVRAASLQAVSQVIHAVQELAAGQGVVTQLLQVLGPKVLAPITCHCVITLKQSREMGTYLLNVISATKYDYNCEKNQHNNIDITEILHTGKKTEHMQLQSAETQGNNSWPIFLLLNKKK